MARRNIHIWPDAVLAQQAAPVRDFDDNLRDLVRDLFDTMYAANGIGLAANQIGVLQQVLVIDLDPHHDADRDAQTKAQLQAFGYSEPFALINPKIVDSAGQVCWQEGCLSVPGIEEEVLRRDNIVVESHNLAGQVFQLKASGLLAVAIQHEMDHLAGIVFVEHLSRLKRDLIRRKMERFKARESSRVR